MVIRSSIELGNALESRIRRQLARRIGHAAPLVERGTVRFDDVNGPKGGIDTACRIKLVITGRPSLVIEKRADNPGRAFAAAVESAGVAVERTLSKHQLRAGRPRRARSREPAPRQPAPREVADAGELIGRRVGRGPDALARVREKASVNPSTAERNVRARYPRATATLEDSRTRPSRKSTRRSANRGKPSQTRERTAIASAVTPGARASRGR
jgi:hypothetical protein